MSGAFPALQAMYAARRVATYPVTVDPDTGHKKPAVAAYQRVGAPYSAQLALKFPDIMAAGFCAGLRNRLTIVDIDSTDDRLVDEIQRRYGVTPLQVVTPSGGRHLYYRHGGEARRIRPLPDVDILGAGNVVAALSEVPKGRYAIERGSLDDLDRLPKMRTEARRTDAGTIPDGKRDNTLFRMLLRAARHCDDFESLLDVARTMNMECVPPMTDAEVLHVATSAWNYEISGKNWVGRKPRTSTDREEILAFKSDPAAALLLNLLRVSHRHVDATFAIDQVATAELLNWDRERLRARIKALIDAERLVIVHRGRGKGDPHLYKLVR